MPYIKKEDQQPFESAIMEITDAILEEQSETSRAGMLNYVFSSIISDLLDEEGLTYDRGNKYIGVLECAKLEIYRRVMAPYEDEKIKENGDVF